MRDCIINSLVIWFERWLVNMSKLLFSFRLYDSILIALFSSLINFNAEYIKIKVTTKFKQKQTKILFEVSWISHQKHQCLCHRCWNDSETREGKICLPGSLHKRIWTQNSVHRAIGGLLLGEIKINKVVAKRKLAQRSLESTCLSEIGFFPASL